MKRRVTFSMIVTALCCLIAFSIGRLFAQTQITPRQIRGLGTVVLMRCNGVTGPGEDCTGMLYIDAVGADGREFKVIGTVPPAGIVFDPAHWSIVP